MPMAYFAGYFKSAVLALFLSLLAAASSFADEVKFSSELLTITSTGGRKHQFTVDLAVTPAQRERGLMFRKSMGRDAGMLFDFGESRPVMMWMKNTDLPLDMLFIYRGAEFGPQRHLRCAGHFGRAAMHPPAAAHDRGAAELPVLRNENAGQGSCPAFFSGDPGRIRTCDNLLRRQVLYPAELRDRIAFAV